MAKLEMLFVVSYLPGGRSSSAASRLDQMAFSGPSGSAASDQTFTAERFYSWLLTAFDEVCLPLIIVSNVDDRTFPVVVKSLICGTVCHHTSLLSLSPSSAVVLNHISSHFLILLPDSSLIARDSVYAIARICYRPSGRPDVCHTGGSVKNG